MLDHSPEAARGVLHGLFGWAEDRGELVEVSIKSPAREVEDPAAGDLDALLDPETIKQLAYWSGEGREVYMGCVGLTGQAGQGVAARRRGAARTRGRAVARRRLPGTGAGGRRVTSHGVDKAVEIVDAALGADARRGVAW